MKLIATATLTAITLAALPAIAEPDNPETLSLNEETGDSIFIRQCGLFRHPNGCDEQTEQYLRIEQNQHGIASNHAKINGAIRAGAEALNGVNSRLSTIEQGVAFNRTAIEMMRDDVDSNSAASAGAAALAGIDFVENRIQIGAGLSNFDGTTGWAVKGMVPIGGNFHGSVGVFGADGKAGGTIAGVLKF